MVTISAKVFGTNKRNYFLEKTIPFLFDSPLVLSFFGSAKVQYAWFDGIFFFFVKVFCSSTNNLHFMENILQIQSINSVSISPSFLVLVIILLFT